MSTLHTLPQSPAQAAWRRYAKITLQVRDRPSLLEDEAHQAARRQAYREFTVEFERECGRA